VKNSAKHISDRIRLMIATKQFQVGEMLPSTRELGQQLEASFHTVRKAYHVLAEEGLITGEQGRGFVVSRQNTNLDKSERLETGADKMRTLLEELIGYGLDEVEIESLFEEMMGFMEWPDRIQSSAAVGETEEMAKMLSEAIRLQVGLKSSVLDVNRYDEAVNYDALFVPIQLFSKYRPLSETLRILPVVVNFDPDVLLSIVDRAAIETMGLVTAEESTIPKLINELKQVLKFEGSFVAGATYGKSLPLFVRNIDLVLYTPSSAKLVEQKIPENKRLKLEYILSDKSAHTIRAELWDQ